jgi:uncharacterized protein YkwD
VGKGRALALAAGLTGLATVPSTEPPKVSSTSITSLSEVEAGFLEQINALRATRGLRPVVLDERLSAIAREWSGEMADLDDIAHNPDYVSQVRSVVGPVPPIGENVAFGGPGAEDVSDGLAHSPSHLGNLVNPAFTKVGIGVVQRGRKLFVTENFSGESQSRKRAKIK